MLHRLVVLASLSAFLHTWAQAQTPPGSLGAPLPAGSVGADLRLLREAVTAYHSGLNKYGQQARFEAHLHALDVALAARSVPVPEGEAVLLVASALRVLSDSHTEVTPVDQDTELRERLWGGRTVLPFAFRVVGDEDDGYHLVVTADLTDASALPRGTEVAEIDGHSVSDVLERLLAYASGDGAGTDALRLARLSVPETAFELSSRADFDAFYPLLYSATSDRVPLVVRQPGTADWRPIVVERLTRAERAERAYAGRSVPPTGEASWMTRMIGPETALIRLGTFATWGFETPPDTLLARIFRDLKQRGTRRLVLDVRGVPGGNLGALAVARYLTTEPVSCLSDATVVAAQEPDPAFFPYLEAYGGGDGWKRPLPDAAVEPLPDGQYRLLAEPPCQPPPVPAEAFGGPVAVLADAWNESATFSLLRVVREQALGTIVGRPAGGNLRGLTAGIVLRLRLPRTGLVVALPLLSSVPSGEPADGPLIPDVTVEWTAADIAAARDPDLDIALSVLGDP